MTRQTDMSLQEIVDQLGSAAPCSGGKRTPGPGYPIGLLVNEIGEIFLAKGEDAAAAEAKLAELLTSNSAAIRWIASQYLRRS